MSPAAATAAPLEDVGRWLDQAAFSLLLITIAWGPLALGGTGPMGLLGIRLGVLLCGLLWLAGAALMSRISLPRAAAAFPLIGYLLLVALSAMTSRYAFAGTQAALDAALYCVVWFVACGTLRSWRRRRALIVVVVAVSAVVAAYGVLQLLGLGWTPVADPARVSSTYFNSNHFSGFVCLMAPVCWSVALHARRILVRTVCAIVGVLLMFDLVFSFSWGLLAGAVAVAAVFGRWSLRLCSSAARLAAWSLPALAAVAGILLMVAYSPALPDGRSGNRLTALFDEHVARSYVARMEIVNVAISMVADRPWLGTGPGSFPYAFTPYRAAEVQNARDATTHVLIEHAHNDYAHIAAETGVLSLLLLLVFIITVFTGRKSCSAPAVVVGASAALGAILLHGLTDGNLVAVPANAVLAFFWLGVLESTVTPRRRHRHVGSAETTRQGLGRCRECSGGTVEPANGSSGNDHRRERHELPQKRGQGHQP